MPFGLKNVRVTYERLMNKYINKTCRTLRTYGIKLNPSKCLFNTKSGHFLGYIVTERGIEANPSKWDAECDRALEELKEYLNSLPILAKPIVGESLWIYLSFNEHVVELALVRQNDQEQQPVYFLSHILKDTESRYTDLEKLAYALVLAAWRLRPYFLAHSIIVMTNSTLERVLLNPEASRWLIKWTTKLSKFDIQYQPRATIKAQALGSGINILLISPREDWMQLSVRLNYRVTNNEAEYEALIAGLYLRLYAKAFEKLKTNFQEVIIQKIPRSENQEVDELAKLASSLTPIIIGQPIEQVSLVAHIDWMEGITFPNDWRISLTEFLQSGAAPSDPEEARLLKKRVGWFTLVGDQLYK
ncbi:uncharacterized protein LOC122036704 [Zingiber officinale]|uniref:uncharacterized protein LOC122036704 n=1 Tax=Zingiber officinale TaxID=94328 RepID=UPI001C4C1183|nr:uncharacterized protein LOC122036704 [Zingiber officinale]